MQTFLYSPLTSDSVTEKNNPELLLLFILKEVFKNPRACIEEETVGISPFEWAKVASSTLKLREYFSLLPIAFPDLISQIPPLTSGTPVQQLFTHFEPFIWACRTNENILLFLLRHQKKLAVKVLLDKICPEGLEEIKNKISAGFNKRGYYFRRWTHSPQKSSPDS